MFLSKLIKSNLDGYKEKQKEKVRT